MSFFILNDSPALWIGPFFILTSFQLTSFFHIVIHVVGIVSNFVLYIIQHQTLFNTKIYGKTSSDYWLQYLIIKKKKNQYLQSELIFIWDLLINNKLPRLWYQNICLSITVSWKNIHSTTNYLTFSFILVCTSLKVYKSFNIRGSHSDQT